MLTSITRRGLAAWAIVALCVSGCGEPATDTNSPLLPDRKTFVPVTGTVKVRGKPLSVAVVTFLPESGAPGVGETDENGKYELNTIGSKGIPPGSYKVGISYFLSKDGEPQGVGPRGAMAQPPGMLSAKEVLPKKYSSLGETELKVVVEPKGGAFDFDLDADLPPAPEAKPAEAKADPAPAPEAKDAETKPAPEPAKTEAPK